MSTCLYAYFHYSLTWRNEISNSQDSYHLDWEWKGRIDGATSYGLQSSLEGMKRKSRHI